MSIRQVGILAFFFDSAQRAGCPGSEDLTHFVGSTRNRSSACSRLGTPGRPVLPKNQCLIVRTLIEIACGPLSNTGLKVVFRTNRPLAI